MPQSLMLLHAKCYILLACLLFIWNAQALPSLLESRQDDGDARQGPIKLLRKQFANPSEVISILLLIGGEVIQKAIAQMTGHTRITPVLFSFGWVSYAFIALSNAIGDGTFLPRPDYSGFVATVKSGDLRENQSWVVGRLIRDLELETEKNVSEHQLDTGLLVSVYKAMPWSEDGATGRIKPEIDWVWWAFFPSMALQFTIAALPFIWSPNWYIIGITVCGNLLAIITSSGLGTAEEKYACRLHSKEVYALARGNGHKHVFIILPDTIRMGRDDQTGYNEAISSLPRLDDLAAASHRAGSGPRALAVILAVAWVVLLIVIGGMKEDTWFLFGVGIIGMAHNILVAGVPRAPCSHGIPLKLGEPKAQFGKRGVGNRPQVNAVLKDLEDAYPNAGLTLRKLFFNFRETSKEKWEWGPKKEDVDARWDRWKEQEFPGET